MESIRNMLTFDHYEEVIKRNFLTKMFSKFQKFCLIQKKS